MLTTGSHGLYEWLVTDQEFDLLQVCPEVVLGKYIAITSIDSGALALSDGQKAAGWETRERIAYSPQIESVEDVPRAGWDEWYIFDKPGDLGTSHLAENIFEVPQGSGNLSVFVNYCFTLHRPDVHVDLFWPQLLRIQPETYVADSEWLVFVTLNKALFARVRDALSALE